MPKVTIINKCTVLVLVYIRSGGARGEVDIREHKKKNRKEVHMVLICVTEQQLYMICDDNSDASCLLRKDVLYCRPMGSAAGGSSSQPQRRVVFRCEAEVSYI